MPLLTAMFVNRVKRELHEMLQISCMVDIMYINSLVYLQESLIATHTVHSHRILSIPLRLSNLVHRNISQLPT